MQTDQYLGDIADPIERASAILETVRAIAERVLSLSDDQYCQWVRPDDPAAHRAARLARQSSDCGLVGLALLRSLGCRHEAASASHRPGMAPYPFGRLRAAAGEAWHGSDSVPKPGDIVIIGADGNADGMRDYGHPGHCLTVITEEIGHLRSLDGGETAPHMTLRNLRVGRTVWVGGRRVWGLCRTTDMTLTVAWEMPGE
jgi:hypothetical protein